MSRPRPVEMYDGSEFMSDEKWYPALIESILNILKSAPAAAMKAFL
jgi:hypothetical protein